ncbi:VCBS repeat-containing protein [Brasilonema sp. CT11]|nr:VCBS repeat-containing protein [Brasilonema sp. CT11]
MVQTLNVSGTTNYTAAATPQIVAANLTISDADNGNLDGVSVIINSNFNKDQDQLGINGQNGTNGTVNGLSWKYDASTGILSITGAASSSAYQDALRQVTYSNTSNTPTTAARGIEFTLGTTLGSADNNHFYQFVSAPNITWTEAESKAAGLSYLGLKGYLATITSDKEENFIQGKLQGNGWIGGSDAATEGDWRWVTGPEAGTQFWSGGADGSAVNGQYTDWAPGEPNNLFGNEKYAHLIGNSAIGQTLIGKWNDLSDKVDSGEYIPQGYIVEYGGSQGDPTVQLTGSVTVNVTGNASVNSKNPAKLDFTGDGKPDILWRNYKTDETAIWQLDGTTFKQAIGFPPTQNTAWRIQGQADFTGDGKTDILWRNYATGENGIWGLNGTTTPNLTFLDPEAQLSWEVKGLSDFTGDGKTDILWRNKTTGENAIWGLNADANGKTVVGAKVALEALPDTNWEIKGLADFTGDGKDEILWRNKSTGENQIWQLNGTTVQQKIALPTLPDTGWDIAGEADFTGDGKTDILWRNYKTGENAVWQMDGTTQKQAIALNKLDIGWQVAGLADFTNDGKVDILWRNSGTDETAIWALNGTSEQASALPKTGSTAWEISFPTSFPAGTVG